MKGILLPSATVTEKAGSAPDHSAQCTETEVARDIDQI